MGGLNVNIPHDREQKEKGSIPSTHPMSSPATPNTGSTLESSCLPEKVLVLTPKQTQCCLWEGEEGAEIGIVRVNLSNVLILLEEKFYCVLMIFKVDEISCETFHLCLGTCNSPYWSTKG